MGKRKHHRIGLVVFVVLLLIITIIILLYTYLHFLPNKSSKKGGRVLENPVKGLSDEEGVALFNEEFVLYLLYSISAQKLHNPPLSDSTPKIEILVDNNSYTAEIIEGTIRVQRGSFSEKDIIIRTSAREVVRMLRDREYVVKSFKDGGSSIDLAEDKPTLLSKGYWKIYDSLT